MPLKTILKLVEKYKSEYKHLDIRLQRLSEDFVHRGYDRLAHHERWDKLMAALASVIKDPNPGEGAKKLVMMDIERLEKECDELVSRG